MKEKILEINIIDHLKKGDESAFRFIYDHYYTGLCRVARGYLTDPYLSESIVGDVIYNLWENYERLEIISLKNYLYRSVSNRCINYLQLEFIKKETVYSGGDINILSNLWVTEEDNPIEKLIEVELNNKIHEIIDQFSSETKQAFFLSRFENKKYEEIADIMGITVNTVKYHIKSALAQLREKLKGYLYILLIIISDILN